MNKFGWVDACRALPFASMKFNFEMEPLKSLAWLWWNLRRGKCKMRFQMQTQFAIDTSSSIFSKWRPIYIPSHALNLFFAVTYLLLIIIVRLCAFVLSVMSWSVTGPPSWAPFCATCGSLWTTPSVSCRNSQCCASQSTGSARLR